MLTNRLRPLFLLAATLLTFACGGAGSDGGASGGDLSPNIPVIVTSDPGEPGGDPYNITASSFRTFNLSECTDAEYFLTDPEIQEAVLAEIAAAVPSSMTPFQFLDSELISQFLPAIRGTGLFFSAISPFIPALSAGTNRIEITIGYEQGFNTVTGEFNYRTWSFGQPSVYLNIPECSAGADEMDS